MWVCSKCGAQVDAEIKLCGACGTSSDGVENPNFVRVDGPAPTPDSVTAPSAPAAPLSVGRRTLQGAKKGLLLGALYGVTWAFIAWLPAAVFVTDMPNKGTILVNAVVQSGLIGTVAGGLIGGLFRLFVPPKPKKEATATLPDAGPTGKS
jgi:hypothetical protein